MKFPLSPAYNVAKNLASAVPLCVQRTRGVSQACGNSGWPFCCCCRICRWAALRALASEFRPLNHVGCGKSASLRIFFGCMSGCHFGRCSPGWICKNLTESVSVIVSDVMVGLLPPRIFLRLVIGWISSYIHAGTRTITLRSASVSTVSECRSDGNHTKHRAGAQCPRAFALHIDKCYI